jgi:hypothetical protein
MNESHWELFGELMCENAICASVKIPKFKAYPKLKDPTMRRQLFKVLLSAGLSNRLHTCRCSKKKKVYTLLDKLKETLDLASFVETLS